MECLIQANWYANQHFSQHFALPDTTTETQVIKNMWSSLGLITQQPTFVIESQPVRELLLEWAKENQSRYSEGYFERGEGSCYVNYSWKPELITP